MTPINSPGSIQVVGLPGSLRENSITRMAIAIALRGSKEAGAQTRILDLRDYRLSMLEEEWNQRGSNPNVLRLRKDLRDAQGIILATPEYHGGYSGVLKHALDLTGFDEFEGKMIGLVGVAGGKQGANESLSSLRAVGRALHAWVIPEQVSIPEAWRKFTPEGVLKDKELEERLLEVGRQVARFALLHSAIKDRGFIQEWEIAPENPGGRPQ